MCTPWSWEVERSPSRSGTAGSASAALADAGELPANVALLVAGKEIDVLPCRLSGRTPLDPQRFSDPSLLLQGFAAPPPQAIRTNRRRGPVLSALGLGLLGAGTLAAADAARTHGFEPTPGLLAGAAMILCGLVALAAMCVPFRQLHSNELRLREFGSRRSALRYAARVALSLGMRVLDTSNTGT